MGAVDVEVWSSGNMARSEFEASMPSDEVAYPYLWSVMQMLAEEHPRHGAAIVIRMSRG